jgi:hypothetical protein
MAFCWARAASGPRCRTAEQRDEIAALHFDLLVGADDQRRGEILHLG